MASELSRETGPTERQIKLVPASFDPLNPKAQLSVAALVSALLIACFYGSTLQSGFIASDFQILRAISASSQASAGHLWNLLTTSQMAHDCGMVPLTWFVIDWFVWHGHSAWYHLGNLTVLFFCAILVAQITSQIAWLRGNRLGSVPGMWAALLFCLYPAQTEIASWISAKSHLILVLFYLSTIFFYLRFRMIRERGYLNLALMSAAAAYLSDPISWSLPLLITAAEFLLLGGLDTARTTVAPRVLQAPVAGATKGLTQTQSTQASDQNVLAQVANPGESVEKAESDQTNHSSPEAVEARAKQEVDLAIAQGLLTNLAAEPKTVPATSARAPQNASNVTTVRMVSVLFFWVSFIFICTIGLLAPNAVPLTTAITQHTLPLPNLSFPATLLNLLAPFSLNGSYSPGFTDAIQKGVLASASMALIIFAIRGALRSVSIRTLAFLCLWLGVSIAPLSQMHIYQQAPIGNNVFYLAAAPLSILLSLLCLPASGAIKLRTNVILTAIGSCALSVIVALWAWTSSINSQPWIQAGTLMRNVRAGIETAAKTCSGKVILAQLPPAIQGVKAFPDAFSLYAAFSPPFAKTDLTDRLLTASQSGSDGQQFIWPSLLKNQLHDSGDDTVLIWNKSTNQYIYYSGSTGAPALSAQFNKDTLNSFTIEPPPKAPGTAGSDPWTNVSVTPLADALRLAPGKDGVTLWLPPIAINPMDASAAMAKLLYTSKNGCHTCGKGNIKLVWKDSNGVTQLAGEATVFNQSFGEYLVWLGRYPAWTLANTIQRVGLRFEPGEYYVDVQSLALIPATKVKPKVQMKILDNMYAGTLEALVVPTGASAELVFDGTAIPEAVGTKVAVFSVDASLDTTTEESIYNFATTTASPIFTADFPTLKGAVIMPKKLMETSGAFDVRVQGLNKDAALIGLPCEPLRFRTKS